MDKIIAEVIKCQDYAKLGSLIDQNCVDDIENACTCEFTSEMCIGIGCIFVNPIKMIASCFSPELRRYIYKNCTLGLSIFDNLGDDVMAELASVRPKLLYVGYSYDRSLEFGYSRYEVRDGKLVVIPRFYANCEEDDCTVLDVDFSELEMLVMMDKDLYDAELMPNLKCIYCYNTLDCPEGFNGRYINGDNDFDERPLQIYEQKYACFVKSARNI